jgi:hypothetical protein
MILINAIVAASVLTASAVTAAPSAPIAARQGRGSLQMCREANFVDCYDLGYDPNTCSMIDLFSLFPQSRSSQG